MERLVRNRTLRQGDLSVGVSCCQVRLSQAVDRETHVVAVVPGIIAWYSCLQRWVLEATNVVQKLPDDLPLPLQLCRVVHMLELAATARAEDRTQSLYAVRRWLVNLGNPDPWRPWFPASPAPPRTGL